MLATAEQTTAPAIPQETHLEISEAWAEYTEDQAKGSTLPLLHYFQAADERTHTLESC